MSTPMALATTDPTERVRRSDRLLAPVCLALAVTLLRSRFSRVVAVVRWTGQRFPRPASTAEAISMTTAVREAARHRCGRVACLERSVAAVLLATAHRRSVQWRIGVRLMPYASHAWIEVGGHPVGEPGAQDRPYLPVLSI